MRLLCIGDDVSGEKMMGADAGSEQSVPVSGLACAVDGGKGASRESCLSELESSTCRRLIHQFWCR